LRARGTGREENEERVLERIRRAFGGQRLRGDSDGLRSAAGSRFLSLGVGDDAALVSATPGYDIVLTCDWFLEGTHFLRGRHPADAVGWKCLARAVSDIAAMGAVPRSFLLSLALPRELAGSWLDEFLGGLRRAAKRFGCSLAGGDTTERREVLINVTVVGEVRRGREVRLRKHLYPEPRVELGRWLSEKGVATTMMDLSDGLSSDLRRLCAASRIGAVINSDHLPTVRVTKPERNRRVDPLQLALHGGDDYELLFTVPKSKAKRLPRSVGGVTLTRIGEITQACEVMVVDGNGRPRLLESRGWDPFRTSK